MDTVSFWKELCEDLDFRFFTGNPNDELSFLFNSMDQDLLHYIPTTTNIAAVGLAGGVSLGGYKSAVLTDDSTFDSASLQIREFILGSHVPILFIDTLGKNPLNLKTFIYGKDSLGGMVEYMTANKEAVILLVKDD